MLVRVPFALMVVSIAAWAAQVTGGTLGDSADEDRCAIDRPATRFQDTTAQVFLRFAVAGLRASDRLRVDWVGPSGIVVESQPYEELEAPNSLCLLNALPVTGFEAAQAPGQWAVHVIVNERTVLRRLFRIDGEGLGAGVRISQVDRRRDGSEDELTVTGQGFDSESTVNLAQYTSEGGWNYVAVMLPVEVDPARIRVRLAALTPGEYVVVVRGSSGRVSSPARMPVETRAGYRLPLPAGVPWMITQTPYGGFSHYKRSLHAWDIAPLAGRCIAAMRGGVVHAFDRKQGRMPNSRSFGNYITIQHDNGEYSHYAHLKTGTFLVRTGQRVEQGQPLAEAGNSGRTLGAGGGYHLHAHVTRQFPIASQSIPFRFEDWPERKRGTVISRNDYSGGGCGGRRVEVSKAPAPATSLAGKPLKRWSAEVWPTGQWTEVFRVPSGKGVLSAEVSWRDVATNLDLYLISPSGVQHGPGVGTGPEALRIDRPEPGVWRVAIVGQSGTSQASFEVSTSLSND